MTKKINCLWSKKKQDDAGLYWLPLMQHLIDTMAVMDFLWDEWLGDGQKDLIIRSMNDRQREKAKQVALFLAAVHDIGKATPAFQLMKSYGHSNDVDFELREKIESVFPGISNIELPSREKTHHSIAGEFLLSKYGVNNSLSVIVGAHHGKPIDSSIELDNQNYYKSNYYEKESENDIAHQQWCKLQSRILQWALKESGFINVEDLPSFNQIGQVILSGLLIMADWIASNETYFPLISIDEDGIEDQESRNEYAYEMWKYENSSNLWKPHESLDIASLYMKRFNFSPREIQLKLAEVINICNEPGIFIVEAPMGVGKTEASLIAAEYLAEKTGRNGIFFGLPTQATSNGIFPRIKHWLQNVKDDEQNTLSLRLVHGKAYLNDEFRSLASEIYDEEDKGNIVVNEWFSGRKTSVLDDFVVGTVDQFLLTALKQKHLALRHLGFSKKVVIIDEVHAYDAYMSQYLYEAIRWMGAYHVPVIIMSATLPQDKRIDLIKNYLGGLGTDIKVLKHLKDNLDTEAYPLITYTDGSIATCIDDFQKVENKTIKINRMEEDELVANVCEYYQEGGVIGVIVNTVKKSQMLAEEFITKLGVDAVELLHSGFIATERVEKEQELLREIGKNGNRPKRRIIIGTQVIEQSLDIDFDVLFTDLAPIDLLIQRIGRLHRHNIERPKKWQNPEVFIIGTNENLDFDEGSMCVYGGYLLAKTQAYLPNEIRIPNDISHLVQAVYGTEEPRYDDERKVKYENYEEQHQNFINNQKKKALNYRIGNPILKDRLSKKSSLIGWLHNSSASETEEKAYAQVRDSDETIEIIALKQCEDGYRIFSKQEEISCDLLEDERIAKEIAKQTLILPRALTQPYNITRTIEELEKYNLNKLAYWQESSWLKGALGIIFDDNNQFILNGFKLTYNKTYGIQCERVK